MENYSWKRFERLQMPQKKLTCFEWTSASTFPASVLKGRSLSWKLKVGSNPSCFGMKTHRFVQLHWKILYFLFGALLSPNIILCSITSICPQSSNHRGAALTTTTASLKKKHDQHYLYKGRQQQQQQVRPRWLRGSLQNEKSVFSSLISPDRGQKWGPTQKTDEPVNRVRYKDVCCPH